MYLLQATMFCKGPICHDGSCNHHEDSTCYSLCSNVETQPLVYLRCIVCACNNVKQKTTWDLITSTSTRTSKTSQQDVAIKVWNLTEHPKPKPNLHLKITHRHVKRVIDVIGNPSTKCPVISTVPEDIGDRWSGVAESMNEKGLHDTLEVMKTPVVHGICLHWVNNTFALVTK